MAGVQVETDGVQLRQANVGSRNQHRNLPEGTRQAGCGNGRGGRVAISQLLWARQAREGRKIRLAWPEEERQ